MKIGFCFFGILYGPRGGNASHKDFRHCWPNIKKMLIDPFVVNGHEAKIYFSSYNIADKQIEEELITTTKMDDIVYSDFNNSTPFTTKLNAIKLVENKDVDVVLLTRSDIHFSKVIANDNIDMKKFNFLFKEKNHWDNFQFTTDNWYMWPSVMTSIVKTAMQETYLAFRPAPMYDSHGLIRKLRPYISDSNINFVSETHELSDINSYYTLCRTKLPTDRMEIMHPEVIERFYK